MGADGHRLLPAPSSVLPYWWFEIDPRRSIYTTKINKCFKSHGWSSPTKQLLFSLDHQTEELRVTWRGSGGAKVWTQVSLTPKPDLWPLGHIAFSLSTSGCGYLGKLPSLEFRKWSYSIWEGVILGFRRFPKAAQAGLQKRSRATPKTIPSLPVFSSMEGGLPGRIPPSG